MSNKKLSSLQINSRDIKHIVCAVDLSSRDKQALSYATALAIKLSATLTICHCCNSDKKENNNYLKEMLKERVHKEIAPNLLKKLHWKCVIVESHIDELASILSDEQIDLIVMSSRGRSITTTLMGSNAEKLSHLAPCPVLILHPDEREFITDEVNTLSLTNLLVAFDFTKTAWIALDYALFIARKFNANLHLLYVFPLEISNLWVPPTEEQSRQIAHDLRNALPANFKATNNFQIETREGDPVSNIIQYALEYEIDLICLGAHSREGIWTYLFGATADDLVKKTPCPIFVARNDDTNIF